jgi:hypothetical protein
MYRNLTGAVFYVKGSLGRESIVSELAILDNIEAAKMTPSFNYTFIAQRPKLLKILAGESTCRDIFLSGALSKLRNIRNLCGALEISNDSILLINVDVTKPNAYIIKVIRKLAPKIRIRSLGKSIRLLIYDPLYYSNNLSLYSLILLLMNNPELYSDCSDVESIIKTTLINHQELFKREGTESYTIAALTGYALYSKLCLNLSSDTYIEPFYRGIANEMKGRIPHSFSYFMRFCQLYEIDTQKICWSPISNISLSQIFTITPMAGCW